MRFNKLFVVLPLVFVVFISGCSIPGLGPGSASGVSDIISIESVIAEPSPVKSTQTLLLKAEIKNNGKDPKDNILVKLTNPCTGGSPGWFKDDVKVNCGKGNIDGLECSNLNFIGGVSKTITWTLQAAETKTRLPDCEFAVSVIYSHKSESTVPISFIPSTETAKSVPTAGSDVLGPIKAYAEIDDDQPIKGNSRDGAPQYVTVMVNIDNKGSGFPKSNIPITQLTFEPGTLTPKADECEVKSKTEDIEFEDGKTNPLQCRLLIPSDSEINSNPNLRTVALKTTLSYEYEVRDTTKIRVEP
ncbi:MAG TPA: hypothetical protein VJA47_00460 [archaeon]|nr:hypothetical protein [archaeon]